MKKFLLSYDIIAGKCTEMEVWDVLYKMDNLKIVAKPTFSTLLLESEEEGMWVVITQKLNQLLRGKLYFSVCKVEQYKDKEGKSHNCYLEIPNSESQEQIKKYLEEKEAEEMPKLGLGKSYKKK